MSTKTHGLRRVLLLAATATVAVSAFAADGKWEFREGVGTGGTDWTAWSDTANWTGGVVAAGSAYSANLEAAKNQYIKLPEGTTELKTVSGTTANPAVLYGNGVLKYSVGGNCTGLQLYTPWNYQNNSVYQGPDGITLCGDCTGIYINTLWSGISYYRFDRYANSSDPVRDTAGFPSGTQLKFTGGGGMVFRAPCGSDVEQKSSWSQTAGSAFLAPVGDVGMMPVGTAVTGVGIPAGAFLKRIFPDGTIELSAAATETAASNELTFAPFTSQTTVVLAECQGYNAGGTKSLAVEKYRAADDLRVSVRGFRAASGTTANNGTFRFYTSAGFVPGTLVFRTSTASIFVGNLEDFHIEFGGDTPSASWSVKNAAHTARLTVPEGQAHGIGTFDGETKGTLVKDGAGTLWANVASGALSGAKALTIEGGTLQLAKSGTYDTLALSTVVVKSGTTLDLSRADKSSVADLTMEAGAVLKFSPTMSIGKLSVQKGVIFRGVGTPPTVETYAEGSQDDIVFTGGRYWLDAQPAGGKLRFAVMSGQAEVGSAGDDSLLIVRSDATLHVQGEGTFDVLMVGGGGAGGWHGGGGGGGGVVYRQNVAVADGVYTVGIGAGGLGCFAYSGQTGENTEAFGITAYGGGGGGARGSTGKDGASGGGSGAPYFVYTTTYTCAPGKALYDGTQGYDGGACTNKGGRGWSDVKSGGGGGAGGPGQNATLSKGGDGGVGRVCAITGADVRYGGGGGGGVGGYDYSRGFGGAGGGGDGAVVGTYPTCLAAGVGTDGLGGGGGGGANAGDDASAGGRGGKGILIIRYRASAPERSKAYARGMATGDGTVTRSRGYEIHTFATNGTIVLSQDAVVDMLLVGGGGGGNGYGGGGGGGGGVVVCSNVFLAAGSYAVGVGAGGGAGGAGKNTTVYQVGMSATNFVAYGGGRGGYRDKGGDGASGGGAGAVYYPYTTTYYYKGGKASYGSQGFDGGMSTNSGTRTWSEIQGGGGGGAGGPGGAPASIVKPGDGGIGRLCDFSGKPVYYGGGGGGGSPSEGVAPNYYLSKGGLGGGGQGGGVHGYPHPYVGEAGTDGLGGGGGGGGCAGDTSAAGGRGGSGTVIIRYRTKAKGLMMLVW